MAIILPSDKEPKPRLNNNRDLDNHGVALGKELESEGESAVGFNNPKAPKVSLHATITNSINVGKHLHSTAEIITEPLSVETVPLGSH